MKIFEYKILIVSLIILMSGCTSVKDALTGQKSTDGADQFLVKKKNPLELPPEFNELPIPKNEEEKLVEETEINIKELLGKKSSSESINDEQEKNNSSIEKSILEKIQ